MLESPRQAGGRYWFALAGQSPLGAGWDLHRDNLHTSARVMLQPSS